MKLSDLRPLINDGDWIMHREDCGYRHARHVGQPCDCGADHVNAALPLLLRVAEAAQVMVESLDDSREPFRKHPRPLEEHNARFHLRTALAALDEVQP